MKWVRIAELKSILRGIAGGQTSTVRDRQTPFADTVTAEKQSALKIRKPLPGRLRLNRVPLPKPLKTEIDVVDLLLEERQSHR
jgi:hypothetical protein